MVGHWLAPGIIAAMLHAVLLGSALSPAPPPKAVPQAAPDSKPVTLTIEPVANAATAFDRVAGDAPASPVAKQHSKGRQALPARSASKTAEAPPSVSSPSLTGTAPAVPLPTESAPVAPALPGNEHKPRATASAAEGPVDQFPKEAKEALKPRLLSPGYTCQGLLAGANLAAPVQVTIVLSIERDGSASATSVRAPTVPSVRGISEAAQRCAKLLHFSPARNLNGEHTTASAVVKVTFSNHRSAHMSHNKKKTTNAI